MIPTSDAGLHKDLGLFSFFSRTITHCELSTLESNELIFSSKFML